MQVPKLEGVADGLSGEELQSVPGIPTGDGHKCS